MWSWPKICWSSISQAVLRYRLPAMGGCGIATLWRFGHPDSGRHHRSRDWQGVVCCPDTSSFGIRVWSGFPLEPFFFLLFSKVIFYVLYVYHYIYQPLEIQNMYFTCRSSYPTPKFQYFQGIQSYPLIASGVRVTLQELILEVNGTSSGLHPDKAQDEGRGEELGAKFVENVLYIE